MFTPTAYECKTLYQAPAGGGYQIVFSVSKTFVSVLCRGGLFWVRPQPAGARAGVVPTSPIPSAGVVADGWIRIGDGESATFGDNGVVGIRKASGSNFATLFLDVWCESMGDLVAVSE